MTTSLTYTEAIQELETLLRDIEDDGTDIDALTEKVKRAAELIQSCKHKLRNAEDAIGQVFREMDEES